MKYTYGTEKKKRDIRGPLIIILVVIIAVQAILLIRNPPETLSLPPLPGFQPGEYSDVPIPVDGYEKPDVSVSPSVIYLTSGCRQLAMVTTESQTYSIQNGLEKKIDFRPTTHDVFKDLVENFAMTVKAVKIESLEDSTYYSKLYIQQGNRLLGLDSKPSDSIAVAVRFDAPVYVKSEIMSQGENIC